MKSFTVEKILRFEIQAETPDDAIDSVTEDREFDSIAWDVYESDPKS